MKKIKVGLIGTGYVSDFHIDALKRIGFADVVGIADINKELAKRKAVLYSIPKVFNSAQEILEDNDIEVIHNCTPNNLHFEINKRAIEFGKHIFSEKPLAINSIESTKLISLLKDYKGIVAGVNFLYRMNPLVQEIKQKIKNGDIGRPILAHGSYLQDWLLYKTDYNWRVEKSLCGASRVVADLGSHWIDAVQTVLCDKISQVLADLAIIHKTRNKSKKQIETFRKSSDGQYEEIDVDTEDYGAVLFKTLNNIHGVFYVSQISAGRKCFFNFEIDGTESSIYWNQEIADWMWIGNRDNYNQQVMRNPNIMTKEARQYTVLAAGHPEGWNDAQKNNIYSFYKYIIDGKKLDTDIPDFATFDEAHYIVKLTEAILESSKSGKWVKV